MTILTPGYRYELMCFEPPMKPEDIQEIQFIEKIPLVNNPTVFETVNNGTTNEEVLTVLIDRMHYLQTKFPCRENAIVLTHLETALLWLNERTNKRRSQNVEGAAIAHK
jgi:hypothetical protein